MPQPHLLLVTPYAGVWIETARPDCMRVLASMSRLMQACGLKPRTPNNLATRWTSRLMQACGLKRHRYGLGGGREHVTPYAGVWIETTLSGPSCPARRVTPYAGVWIETAASGPSRRGCCRHACIRRDADTTLSSSFAARFQSTRSWNT